MLIEIAVTAVAWTVQIAAVLLVAFIVAAAVKIVEETIRKRRAKWFPRVLAAFLLLCVILAALSASPFVICSKNVEEERLTDYLRDSVRSGAAGVYSWKLPLVPVCAEITSMESCLMAGRTEYTLEFSVHYFCFGIYRMEFSTLDGYNAYPMF